jgi:hypothetical protein
MHGLTGCIVRKVQLDAQLAFIATAKQFTNNFKPYSRQRVVQIAGYFLSTRDMALAFHRHNGAPPGSDSTPNVEV